MTKKEFDYWNNQFWRYVPAQQADVTDKVMIGNEKCVELTEEQQEKIEESKTRFREAARDFRQVTGCTISAKLLIKHFMVRKAEEDA